jgi:hypothetical protein
MNRIVVSLLLLVSTNAITFSAPAQTSAAPAPKVTPCEVVRDPIAGKQYKFLSERRLTGKKYTYRIFTYQITEGTKKYYEYVTVNGEQVTALATIIPSYPKVNGKQKTVLDLKFCGLAGENIKESPVIKTSFSNRRNVIYGKGFDKFTANGKVGFSTTFTLFDKGDRDI